MDNLFAACRHGCGAFKGAHDACPLCGTKDVRHQDIGWLKVEIPEREKSPEQLRGEGGEMNEYPSRKAPNPDPPPIGCRPPAPPCPPSVGVAGRKLWVVGKIESDEKYLEWQFIGVFSSETKAETACRSPYHFLAATTLNQDVGDDPLVWPEARYPRRGTREEE